MWIRALGWLLAAAVLLAPTLVQAQQKRPRVLTYEEEKERAIAAEAEMAGVELNSLEKELGHARLLNNPSFFQHVYSDDYHEVNATGEILDKSAAVARVQSSTAKYYTFIVSDISIRIYGGSAVVTCMWTARGEQGGHNFARQYRVIHVYVNNKAGGWKVVAGQETLLPG
jgi:ketosteroid isomerase-like protein